MDTFTCQCVGDLAKTWIEDFLLLKVNINYMEDYSVELQVWDVDEEAYNRIFNGIEGMALMYARLKDIDNSEHWDEQPCIEAYRNESIPKAYFFRIFTEDTNKYAESIGMKRKATRL